MRTRASRSKTDLRTLLSKGCSYPSMERQDTLEPSEVDHKAIKARLKQSWWARLTIIGSSRTRRSFQIMNGGCSSRSISRAQLNLSSAQSMKDSTRILKINRLLVLRKALEWKRQIMAQDGQEALKWSITMTIMQISKTMKPSKRMVQWRSWELWEKS